MSFASMGGSTPELADATAVTFVQWMIYAFETRPIPRIRKRFGVGESAHIKTLPAIENSTLQSVNGLGVIASSSSSGWNYYVGDIEGADMLRLNSRGSSIGIPCEVVAPTGIVAKVTQFLVSTNANMAGSFHMDFDLDVCPLDVSFTAISCKEIGMCATNAVGYFSRPEFSDYLDHSLHGAGNWLDAEFGLSDGVTMPMLQPPWESGGSYTWPVPYVWKLSSGTDAENYICNRDQRFELDADGTSRIRKFGYVISCSTNRIGTYQREN